MFCIGERICYPMHGIGEIEGIEQRRVLGVNAQYYLLKFDSGRVSAMVPVETAEKIGLRRLISRKEGDKVLRHAERKLEPPLPRKLRPITKRRHLCHCGRFPLPYHTAAGKGPERGRNKNACADKAAFKGRADMHRLCGGRSVRRNKLIFSREGQILSICSGTLLLYNNELNKLYRR